MYPYAPPPPQKPSGMSTGAIVAIVVIPIAAIVLLAFGAGVLGALVARSSAKRAARAAAAAPLPTMSESRATQNGLAVAHYPAEFAAKKIDDASLLVSKNNADGTDELVQITAVPNPISDDVDEVGRILENAMKKGIESSGDRWTETSRAHRACFKSYPGLAVEGTFTASGITKEKVRICFFVDGNRGYELKTIVPEIHETADLPVLQAIVDATELK